MRQLGSEGVPGYSPGRKRGFQGKGANWMLRQEGRRKPRRLGILRSQEPGHRGSNNGMTYWNLGLNQMGGPSATMGISCVPMIPGSTRRFMSTGMTGFEYFKPNNGQTYFCKEPESRYFRLCKPYGLSCSYSTRLLLRESNHI